jgi:hypothetical protein
MLSAMMTVGAVFYAYFSDSMPSAYLTDTDEAFIAEFQRWKLRFMESSPVLFVGLCWIVFSNLVLRRTGKEINRNKLTREQREAAVTRFILALSDQQLVVGLAILIAAVTNQHTLTVSEFQIAFALAWFSATTHLTTLDNLQEYFGRYKTLRNWRVIGMLLLMFLFLYCSVISHHIENAGPNTVPAQCYFAESTRQSLKKERPSGRNSNNSSFIGWLMLLLFLISNYINRIQRSYGFDFTTNIITAIMKVDSFVQNKSPKYSQRPSHKERKTMIEDILSESRAVERRLNLDILDGRKSNSQSTGTLRLCSGLYSRSMISIFPPLIFMLTYGFTQMVLYRWQQSNVLDATDMGFGQITPLILLILPAFSAAESYFGTLP